MGNPDIGVGDFWMEEWVGGVLTPAGLPHRASWACFPFQSVPGHQASWQALSCSSSDSLFLLLLHGMAVVPFTELETALETTHGQIQIHVTLSCDLIRDQSTDIWKSESTYMSVLLTLLNSPLIKRLDSALLFCQTLLDSPQIQKLTETLSSDTWTLMFFCLLTAAHAGIIMYFLFTCEICIPHSLPFFCG